MSESSMDINATEMEKLTFHRGSDSILDIGSYCYYYQHNDTHLDYDSTPITHNIHDANTMEHKRMNSLDDDIKLILCRILNFTSRDECLIIDLTNQEQYIIKTENLSKIEDRGLLIQAEELHKQCSTKLNLNITSSEVAYSPNQKQNRKQSQKLRDSQSMNPSYIMTFLCILLFAMAGACFWRADTYFQELKDLREASTTRCNITNYTVYVCQYQCKYDQNSICNGTGYLFKAVSLELCGNQILTEVEEYTVCPQEKITDIGKEETCWIDDCSEGFYLFPPYDLWILDPAGVIWITVGFIIGVCGMWCLLYACGEYITTLGTYDFENEWAATPMRRKKKKCCDCRRSRRQGGRNDSVD